MCFGTVFQNLCTSSGLRRTYISLVLHYPYYQFSYKEETINSTTENVLPILRASLAHGKPRIKNVTLSH